MKNIEKYYSEFMNKSHINPNCYWFKVIRGNEYCDGRSCGQCGEEFLEWLNEEYKEPIKLTEDERVILKNMSVDYRYIGRDKNGDLYIYRNKPERDNFVKAMKFNVYNHLFQVIKWTDKKPYKIKDILENCEVNNDVER